MFPAEVGALRAHAEALSDARARLLARHAAAEQAAAGLLRTLARALGEDLGAVTALLVVLVLQAWACDMYRGVDNAGALVLRTRRPRAAGITAKSVKRDQEHSTRVVGNAALLPLLLSPPLLAHPTCRST